MGRIVPSSTTLFGCDLIMFVSSDFQWYSIPCSQPYEFV